MTPFIRQINLKDGYYIAGFTDGEGSFNISFKKREDYANNIEITASFNISQKEKRVLTWIKSILKCGTIRDRGVGVYYYEVTNLNSLSEKIIPFFERFKLRTRKLKTFLTFKKIVEMMLENKHLDSKGILDIYDLREKIEVARQRKYSRAEIASLMKKTENSKI